LGFYFYCLESEAATQARMLTKLLQLTNPCHTAST